MAKYKLIAGVHETQGSNTPGAPRPVRMKVGDIIESDDELDLQFANKWLKVDSDTAATVTATKEEPKVTESTLAPVAAQSAAPVQDLADSNDVTDLFPEAAEAQYTVVKVGKKYNVLDHGAVLNEALLNKSEVASFIKEFA